MADSGAGAEGVADDCASQAANGSTSSEAEQEEVLLASRRTGERSIETALAEIEIITRNVYVQRKERTFSEEEIPVCSCTPPDDGKMGCLDDCVNRAALIECISGSCPCGNKCDNQRIQRGKMPANRLVECGRKGLGMKLMEDISAGTFVGEYMGEIVTEHEYHLRRLLYHNEKHRYMMVLSGGEVIDATRMGGRARFINHSCDPNCGVEKWDVNGEERCAIFALRDIFAGEELTFDYKFQSFSKLEITECLCGAANCRGVIGANNRVSKSMHKASNGVSVPGHPDAPKIYDPITGGKYAKGKKAADSLMNRMARQRLLSQGELLFLRRSRVLLRRNLERNMEMDFPLLHLQPYFMSEPHGLLEHVPPVLRLRDLPGFPAKLAVLPVESRRKRLEELLHVLRRRRPSI